MIKNKFALKVAAVAVAAALSSSAWAAVDLDDGTGAKAYAKELTYGDANPIAAHADTALVSKLGFGVSAGQDRYVRIQLTNGTFDVAVVDTDLVVDVGGGAGDAAEVVVQGGAIGDNYVIFQITANVNLDASTAGVVQFATPDLRATSTAAAVTVAYQLHETAVSAVAGSAGASVLYQASATLASFANGLVFELTPASSTATVADAFQSFGGALFTALGQVDYTVEGATVLEADHSAVDLADLVTAAEVNVVGNFGAAGSVFLDMDGSGCGVDNGGDIVATLNGALTSGVLVVDANTVAAKNLCYVVTGDTAIPAQTITAALDVTDGEGDDVTADTAGTVVHDGSTLHTPWFTTVAGYTSRFVLTNTGSVDAPYTTSCIAENGNTPTAGVAATGTVPAGKQLIVQAADVCTFSGATRGAITFDIEASTSNIQGVYNVVHQTSGAVSTIQLNSPD